MPQSRRKEKTMYINYTAISIKHTTQSNAQWWPN